MVADVAILLGGNIGDVRSRLAQCREALSSRVGCIKSCSAEVESEAWGFTSALPFVNQAVVLTTELTPHELLRVTQSIEQELGRDRVQECEDKSLTGEPYASRVIDVDIITYGEQIIKSENLIIPHPRMQDRAFVLRPMVEVIPQWRHPQLGLTIEELLKRVI